jgi:hypothetical membrane protein
MSWDTFVRLWRWGNAISLLGVLQFLGCLGLAVQWYAGGSPLEPQATGYSFSGNYLSDLGRDVAWSGVSNHASAILFNASLVVLAVTQVPYFLFLPLHAPDRTLPLWGAAAIGVISCVGLAGVGLAPYDSHLRAHLTSLLWWIVPLLVALVIHALTIFSSDECSPLFSLISLGLAVLVGAYAVHTVAYGLPSQLQGDAALLSRSIVLQKYVLFGCVGWYCVFSLRMLLVLRPPEMNQFTDRDRSTEEYVRRLGR